MKLKELFESQKQLDKLIAEKHNIKKSKFKDKTLAFIIELCELANELRFFKYWSNRGPSSKEIILEEYSDALHFLLSIGNEIDETMNTNLSNYDYKIKLNTDNMADYFVDMIELGVQFKVMKNNYHYSTDIYVKLVERMLCLAGRIGLNIDDIFKGYYKKHQKNIKRQEENY